ncbi:helix-turn-helix transcriptional regulator [Salimicrobium halophilum]|uniref:Transcriptional regulator PadR-like family protein n=1 Tax=Salimicrobium halophilum TaxID=86666 RepID=A0A1G8Q453_9BACI|nr:helix-turn-helix transcriptional regulator [Salimicrobium halophilum]SDI99522.1 Transcriptional regulator PadR-like family protein [Salimicrobium halophilum]
MSHKNNPKKFALNMSAAQFTKFYIMHLLQVSQPMISEHFKKEFKTLTKNWIPAPSTLLDTLHEMTKEGLLHRKEDYKSYEKKRQKVYWYYLTDSGREEFEVLKKRYKILFEEQQQILNKIMRDIYK